MDKIRVIINNDQKEVREPTGLRMLIRRACIAALRLEKFNRSTDVSVTFVDNEKIRELNKKYRNIDSETDVLSFPSGENGEYSSNPDTGATILGDIIISLPKAVEQAKNQGSTMPQEVAFLTIHAMLHLLGYDHENTSDKIKMRVKEQTLLGQIGLLSFSGHDY
ncbi:MAG: rRNA maturation RNase YbeY [Clostridia bacterium]|nr:rRNA maturation RNase YbeY [Clostridia bacterium]